MQTIDIFPWDDNFATGLGEVDVQHRKLVALLNRLASQAAFGSDPHELDAIFDELADYTVYHFQTEESIWNTWLAGDPAETSHQRSHQAFIDTLRRMRQEQALRNNDDLAEEGLEFVARWLASHILESDRQMAQTVLALHEGLDLQTAKRRARERMTGATRALIDIILSIYGKLSRNTLSLMRELATNRKAQEALDQSERRYHEVFQSSLDAINVTADGIYVEVNAAFERMSGYPAGEVLGRTGIDLGLWVDPAERERLIEELRRDGAVRNREARLRRKDGSEFWGSISSVPIELAGRACLLSVTRDVSELRDTASALADSRTLLGAIVDSTSHMIWSVDASTHALTSFNAGLRDHFRADYGIDLTVGMRQEQLFPDDPAHAETWHALYRRALHDGAFSVEYTTTRGDRTLQLNFNPLLRDGVAFGLAVFGEDITARKASEARAEFLAYHDTLTGLPNLALVRDRFGVAAGYAAAARGRLALIALDLDEFKSVNDAIGHGVGDELLLQVAQRLRDVVRDGDTVARLGGDDFLVLLAGVQELDDVVPRVNDIMAALRRPYAVDHRELTVTASAGIALYPDDAQDIEGLLKKADTALFVAKDAGRDDFRFADEAFNTSVTETLALRNGLAGALERGEFELHYQPQIELSSGRMIGAEALLRWRSPERGLVQPGDFIHVAESSGLIVPIGAWVLREACRQAATWRGRWTGDDFTIAVNLSAVQFQRGDLEGDVMRALGESGLDPQALELELTESILVRDPEAVLEVVRRLRQLGVLLAIDDFGTGYSSLSYLRRFPVDKLKIDQSFVRRMVDDAGDAEIVRAVLQMARSLGLKTIAEGIEDGRSAEHLRLLHCDQGQGYHYARPLEPGAFEAYAAARSRSSMEPVST